ncbi:hypothetical protein J6590_068391 [Homalodisca vitripennis]|nr:hypothetical protein J6590_068391 [Homalodisca vitripennis]
MPVESKNCDGTSYQQPRCHQRALGSLEVRRSLERDNTLGGPMSRPTGPRRRDLTIFVSNVALVGRVDSMRYSFWNLHQCHISEAALLRIEVTLSNVMCRKLGCPAMLWVVSKTS